jgi:hypothetical protein
LNDEWGQEVRKNMTSIASGISSLFSCTTVSEKNDSNHRQRKSGGELGNLGSAVAMKCEAVASEAGTGNDASKRDEGENGIRNKQEYEP